MKSLMLKCLTVIALISVSLQAKSVEQKVLDFEQKTVGQQVSIENMEISKVIELDKGWKAYVIDLEVTMKGQQQAGKDLIFTDGTFITRDLSNLDSGEDYKQSVQDQLQPTLSQEYYDEDNLVYGDGDSEHKVVVFSDPVCPYCVKFAPEAMERMKENDSIDLYYYHFPLSFHKSAKPLSLAMIAATQKGMENVEYIVYNAFKEDQGLFEKAKDPKNALEVVNSILGSDLKQSDLEKQSVQNHLQKDKKMANEAGVRGTPTIFVDGKMDKSRQKLQNLLQ